MIHSSRMMRSACAARYSSWGTGAPPGRNWSMSITWSGNPVSAARRRASVDLPPPALPKTATRFMAGAGGLSLGQDLVRPLDQLDEDRRVGEGRVLAGQIRFEDSPSPRAGPSDVQRYPEADGGPQDLGQWRPPDGHDGGRDRIAHHRHRLAEQEDLRLVPRLHQRVGVQEGECGLGRIV